MRTYILTSRFSNGLSAEAAGLFRRTIVKRKNLAFIASEFYRDTEKTEKYFKLFSRMLWENGIDFGRSFLIDGRMSLETARRAVENSDIVWLSGGNTPEQYRYLQEYRLIDSIREHHGTVIGMSAGSINMAKTAICTRSCGHSQQLIYPGIGCVDFSVEPHFKPGVGSEELFQLSQQNLIYGLCDDAVIVSKEGKLEFVGEVYRIENNKIEKVS